MTHGRELNPWEGNKNAFEANQNLNANGKIVPLRDTFYLSLSGEVIRQVFRRCITEIIGLYYQWMPLERFSEFGQYNCTAKTFESKKYMEQFVDSCFNPSNLQFFVFNEMTNEGYTILDEDYTKCYYNDKLSKHLSSSCRHSAVIDVQSSWYAYDLCMIWLELFCKAKWLNPRK